MPPVGTLHATLHGPLRLDFDPTRPPPVVMWLGTLFTAEGLDAPALPRLQVRIARRSGQAPAVVEPASPLAIPWPTIAVLLTLVLGLLSSWTWLALRRR